MHLHQLQEHGLSVGRAGHQARHEHEVGVDEDREQAVAADDERGRADRVAAHPGMRTGKERNQRADAAAEAEQGVPLEPGLVPEHDHLEGPAEVPDDPEADADRERIPEQPLASRPADGAGAR